MHQKQSKKKIGRNTLNLCENQTFPLAVDEEPLLRDHFGKTLLFHGENKTRVESALCSSIYTDMVGPWSPLTSWPVTSKAAPPQWSPNESAHHPEQPALSHIPLPSRLSAWSLTRANGLQSPSPRSSLLLRSTQWTALPWSVCVWVVCVYGSSVYACGKWYVMSSRA